MLDYSIFHQNKSTQKKSLNWDFFEKTLYYLKQEYTFVEIVAFLSIITSEIKNFGDKRLLYAIASRVLETDDNQLKETVEAINRSLNLITLCDPDGEVIFQNGELQGEWDEEGVGNE